VNHSVFDPFGPVVQPFRPESRVIRELTQLGIHVNPWSYARLRCCFEKVPTFSLDFHKRRGIILPLLKTQELRTGQVPTTV
jgi:hypothetical protein